MTAEIKARGGSIVIVAQTPFQLLSAIQIRLLAGIEADLWLLDPALQGYRQACVDLGVWRKVFYVGIYPEVAGVSGLKEKVKRRVRIRLARNAIALYLKQVMPDVIVIFSDNHEITAAFARIGKITSGARIVMVEEGTCAYFSFKRVRAGLFKRWARWLVGIDNPDGYTVGWSPNVDALIVSNFKFAHSDYLQAREVFQFPRGPYPAGGIIEFSKLVPLDRIFERCSGRDIVLLGQPWVEAGLLSSEDELKFYTALDDAYFAPRILLKNHPFERKGKYNYFKNIMACDEMASRIPAEVLFERMKPMIVISFFSSAILNYCLRNGTCGIFIALAKLPQEIDRLLCGGILANSRISVVYSVDDLLAKVNSALIENDAVGAVANQPLDAWKGLVRSALAID